MSQVICCPTLSQAEYGVAHDVGARPPVSRNFVLLKSLRRQAQVIFRDILPGSPAPGPATGPPCSDSCRPSGGGALSLRNVCQHAR